MNKERVVSKDLSSGHRGLSIHHDYPTETSQCYPDHRTENWYILSMVVYWYTHLCKKLHPAKPIRGEMSRRHDSPATRINVRPQSIDLDANVYAIWDARPALDRSKILPRPIMCAHGSNIDSVREYRSLEKAPARNSQQARRPDGCRTTKQGRVCRLSRVANKRQML